MNRYSTIIASPVGALAKHDRNPIDAVPPSPHPRDMTRALSEKFGYQIFSTEAGYCGIAWSDAGIVRFCLPEATSEATEAHLLRRVPGAVHGEPPAQVGAAITAARAYFAGEPVDFSNFALDLDSQSSARQAIYAALRQVDRGKTTTYGALATAAGMPPQAARDVGQAMAHNPIPLIIPCHRVLAAGGKVGGFSAPGGATSKLRMLELEGVDAGQGAEDQYSLPI